MPVVHFYASTPHAEIPLEFEVGFKGGHATRWYPQIDTLRTATDANSEWAQAQREALLKARAARQPYDPATLVALGADPTRQLGWESLRLTSAPTYLIQEDPLATWLAPLRAIDRALWVNGAAESERFLFYEGSTAEAPLLKVERGPSWSATHPHYLLRNTSSDAIHDVFVIQRDPSSAAAKVFYRPSIPAGAAAEVLFSSASPSADDFEKQTHTALLNALTDAQNPSPPERDTWGAEDCATTRDPAIPFEVAEGHQLYQAEAEAILHIWGERFFDQPGTTLLYREDIAYVDAQMPISVFTDMFHFVKIRRASLVLWEGLDLAALSAP